MSRPPKKHDPIKFCLAHKFHTDTNGDPDTNSQNLGEYQRILWNKKLPSKILFKPEKTGGGLEVSLTELLEIPHDPKYIVNNNHALFYAQLSGTKGLCLPSRFFQSFKLSSDTISNLYVTAAYKLYKGGEWQGKPEDEPCLDDIKKLGDLRAEICGKILFPCEQSKYGQTINQAKGFTKQIDDRFDLTLECIRRHYNKKNDSSLVEPNPLEEVLNRYCWFFDLFVDFEGYVKFNHLQDFVSPNFKKVFSLVPIHSNCTNCLNGKCSKCLEGCPECLDPNYPSPDFLDLKCSDTCLDVHFGCVFSNPQSRPTSKNYACYIKKSIELLKKRKKRIGCWVARNLEEPTTCEHIAHSNQVGKIPKCTGCGDIPGCETCGDVGVCNECQRNSYKNCPYTSNCNECICPCIPDCKTPTKEHSCKDHICCYTECNFERCKQHRKDHGKPGTCPDHKMPRSRKSKN